MSSTEEIQRLNTKIEALEQELQTKKALIFLGLHTSARVHRLVNGVMNIKDIVSLIRRSLRENKPLEDIHRSLDSIDAVAEQISHVSPFSLDDVSSINVNDLLVERVRQWRLYHAGLSGGIPIAIALDLEEASPPSVQASPQWLRRCLDILIDNAMGAMQNSPEKLLTLSTTTVGGKVEIRISDRGPGIADSTRQKLFKEPIKGVDKQGNLGVGLLLAKTILETYGGDLQLAHTSLKGTTFVISLPQA